ncbi:hypothetical protein [Haloarchaeobius iranensis]|uniref:Uncharacterized protein n=1 Tax=Haloarchaeobius iranensis TaxID=996166 RepID=A0A1H0A2A6_9EURY|nr:hypothetical protein [Haloarchaeobius iranensis]SDN27942.1 hypothetical protein SAMN05192554_12431 [Haloarchaeobius iranensis]
MSLDWPETFDRTPPDNREPYPHHFQVSLERAFGNVVTQVDRLEGAELIAIETASGATAGPPATTGDIENPGVVVRFRNDGVVYAVPCDRWAALRDNVQAVAKYLEAKRALDRYGVETLTDEFATQKVRLD